MENKALPVKPEILAPAGDRDCFLAALAAGADAIYLGLKNFSARMEAENFGLGLLARLIDLAHANSCLVYVAMNNILKPGELVQAYRLTRRLATLVPADGLIIQDAGMLAIARQAGFEGLIALSTLANVSDPNSLSAASKAGAARVILPRELSIDEIRLMDAACPAGMTLECFVHGALCYCVSGRCYWSSYMGGRSGLRGRCTQPCRRIYTKAKTRRDRGRRGERGEKQLQPASSGERYFACQDLEVGVLCKTLLACPHIASWKIEGRKKGPHYVYHTVTAYRMLRDHGDDPAARKTALEILELALGRPGVSGRFLPQRPHAPMSPGGQTSSGRLAGKINVNQKGECVIRPHFNLIPRDYLRIGVEDEKWHSTVSVTRSIPKGGTFFPRLPRHKTPKAGTPVYLIDRREPELSRLLKTWAARLEAIPETPIRDVEEMPRLPQGTPRRSLPDMVVSPGLREGGEVWKGRGALPALWLTRKAADLPRPMQKRVVFWLPPVIWPDEEEALQATLTRLWRAGARRFVCGSPWQRAYFPDPLPEDALLIAGPFCNISNPLAVKVLAEMGFCAAFASPELSAGDFLALPAHSPLPLGFVLQGHWPVGVSRFGLAVINANEPFFSPKGEVFWARDYGSLTWIYPAWPLDFTSRKKELLDAGYSFFAFMDENVPRNLPRRERPGLFNWEGKLL